MESETMEWVKASLWVLAIILGTLTFITFVIVVAVLILHNAGVGT